MKATLNGALERIGFGKFHWITLILSGIGFGAATVELVAIAQLKPYLQRHWQLETKDLGYMSSATFLGEVIGGLFWGFLSDSYGRESTFLLTSGLMFLFSMALAFCQTYWQFCLVRFVLGFAIGGGLSVDFVYFIECVAARNRSFRTAFIVLIGILGVIYSAGTGLVLLEGYGFRAFLVACCLPSAVLCFGRCLWRYESPKYLMAKGRFEEASELLSEIARINGVSCPKFQLESEFAEQTATATSLRQHWRSITFASIGFFCQTSAYYGLTLWMSRFTLPWGYSTSFMLFLVGLAELPGLLVTSLLLRYSTARKQLLCGAFAAAALLSVAIYWVNSEKAFIAAFCALYFAIVSIWTILYAYVPETFPTTVRSSCLGIAGTFGKIGGILSPLCFARMFQNSGFCINMTLAALFLAASISSVLLGSK